MLPRVSIAWGSVCVAHQSAPSLYYEAERSERLAHATDEVSVVIVGEMWLVWCGCGGEGCGCAFVWDGLGVNV